MMSMPKSVSTASSVAARYVRCSAGQVASLFLRSDGTVDRTTGGGSIKQRLRCEDTKAVYTAVSAGPAFSLLLRSCN